MRSSSSPNWGPLQNLEGGLLCCRSWFSVPLPAQVSSLTLNCRVRLISTARFFRGALRPHSCHMMTAEYCATRDGSIVTLRNGRNTIARLRASSPQNAIGWLESIALNIENPVSTPCSGCLQQPSLELLSFQRNDPRSSFLVVVDVTLFLIGARLDAVLPLRDVTDVRIKNDRNVIIESNGISWLLVFAQACSLQDFFAFVRAFIDNKHS